MTISYERLSIPDVILIRNRIFGDERGKFQEIFRKDFLASLGVEFDPVQENNSVSSRKWTVRGLHFQRPPATQAKLVRVASGAALAVAVDIRMGSATYGKWVSTTMRAWEGGQFLVPHGFAFGFCTLEQDTELLYLCDNTYAPGLEAGLRYDDPAVGIAWPFTKEEVTVNDRDAGFPSLSELDSPFSARAGHEVKE